MSQQDLEVHNLLPVGVGQVQEARPRMSNRSEPFRFDYDTTTREEHNPTRSARCRLAFPKQHLTSGGGNDLGREGQISRPLAIPAELEVVVEEDICEHRLQLARREEPSWAAYYIRSELSVRKTVSESRG